MQLLEMFYDEIQDAVDRKVPFVIPIGTLNIMPGMHPAVRIPWW